MRYTILRPNAPTDVRNLEFASAEYLRAEFPSIADCDLEEEAMRRVRELYPDAVVMPVPIKLGSGDSVLLGVLENISAPRDPEGKIPFVLFVQAISQSNADTVAIKKRRQFSRHIWKVPVLHPSGEMRSLDVELRASDLEQPSKIKAVMFRRAAKHGGRNVLYLELNGVEVSVEFLDTPDGTPIELRPYTRPAY
jgi:hypothetical protein